MSERSESNVGLTDLLGAMRELALRRHYYCEDSWYSCPKAEDGCANDDEGDNCNCGADKHNAEVERVYNRAMQHMTPNYN